MIFYNYLWLSYNYILLFSVLFIDLILRLIMVIFISTCCYYYCLLLSLWLLVVIRFIFIAILLIFIFVFITIYYYVCYYLFFCIIIYWYSITAYDYLTTICCYPYYYALYLSLLLMVKFTAIYGHFHSYCNFITIYCDLYFYLLPRKSVTNDTVALRAPM